MKPPVLIADGDAELCEIYQWFLTQRGYAVETAADGLSCLEKLRRLMPAVVVLDLELRWGGGDGVLAWLRAERAMTTVAVVLTATAASPPLGADAIKPPVVRFLPKPFALADLLESVRDAAGSKRDREELRNRVAPYPELFIG
jgi:DNA-binding NtrC family response regulator